MSLVELRSCEENGDKVHKYRKPPTDSGHIDSMLDARLVWDWHRPWWSPKGSGESFEEASHKPEGVLFCYQEINEGQSDQTVDQQANYDCERIHGNFMAYLAWVSHLNDLSC